MVLFAVGPASTTPVLLKTAKLVLTISTMWFGPTVALVSGGADWTLKVPKPIPTPSKLLTVAGTAGAFVGAVIRSALASTAARCGRSLAGCDALAAGFCNLIISLRRAETSWCTAADTIAPFLTVGGVELAAWAWTEPLNAMLTNTASRIGMAGSPRFVPCVNANPPKPPQPRELRNGNTRRGPAPEAAARPAGVRDPPSSVGM